MQVSEVLRVLDSLAERHVRHWVAGGWGVAVLAGGQTREHRDLDLAVHAEDLPTALAVLDVLGYTPETDWLPTRVEYVAPGRGWVDVHPIDFDATGNGRLTGPNGIFFDYPADGLTSGTLCGRRVPCISVAMQRTFHSGYDPRAQDLHDLACLDALD